MSDDLVKLLRAFARGCRGSAWQSRDETIRLCDDAADRIEELEAALSSIEIDHMLTNNGNLWRFWSNKANAIADKNTTLGKKIEELEAKLAKAVDGLTQIERTYYQEAANPSPETIRRMSARMNGIARDTQDAIAEINGGQP